MAQKVSDEERERRIKLVGDYVKDTEASVRQTALYFTENFFSISIATVSDYLKRYEKQFPEHEVSDIVKEKRGDVSSKKLEQRVLLNAKLCLEGKTVEEIAALTETSYYKVYRDLTVRLKGLNTVLYDMVSARLNSNRMENIDSGKSK